VGHAVIMGWRQKIASHALNGGRIRRSLEPKGDIMQKQYSMTVLAAALAGIALFGAGCSDRSSTETVGQKMDRTTDKMAAATDKATTKAAAAIDDTAITTKVKTAVLAEPGLKTLKIDVDTKNGVVTLAGSVDTAALKERATEIAQGVSGVKSVENNLTVKSTG
jgi:hyperosmotically inducible protein